MDLEIEILKALESKDFRPSELETKLYPIAKSAQKFHPPSEETFRTQLNRALKKLAQNEEIKRLDRGHQFVVYSIMGKGRCKLMTLDINSYFSEMDAGNLQIFRNIITKIRAEAKSPDQYCFTFIGDVPVTFSKTLAAFQQHLDQEKRLQLRYEEEINKINDEFRMAHPDEPHTLWWDEYIQRREKEIGLSLGEYFRKLLRKAENMDYEEKLILLGVIDKPNNTQQKRVGENQS